MEKKISVEKLTIELSDIYNNYALGFLDRMEAVCQSADAIECALKCGALDEDNMKNVRSMITALYRLESTQLMEVAKSLQFGECLMDKILWVANKCMEYRRLCNYFSDWAKITDGAIRCDAQPEAIRHLAFGWLATSDCNVSTYFGDYSTMDEVIEHTLYL